MQCSAVKYSDVKYKLSGSAVKCNAVQSSASAVQSSVSNVQGQSTTRAVTCIDQASVSAVLVVTGTCPTGRDRDKNNKKYSLVHTGPAEASEIMPIASPLHSM